MANEEQVDILLVEGVDAWNIWRDALPDVHPDLRGANLSRANLDGADLQGANLFEANLSLTDLSGADLHGANLRFAHLYKTDLRRADLFRADLRGADLRGADMRQSILVGAICIGTRLSGATLTGCTVYGISAWDLDLDDTTIQTDLHITPSGQVGNIRVDNLEVAQFLYLLLNNLKVRSVLDTITSKIVLILGRFSEERKPILDALREALRGHPNGYIPVLFDFEPQQEKPVLETVKTLANLARFVIADLTDPNMVRSELTYITHNVPTVPIQPLILSDANLPTEHQTWKRFDTYLPVYRYTSVEQLLASLTEAVIIPVEAHVSASRLADADTL